jgi:hypothetical protein
MQRVTLADLAARLMITLQSTTGSTNQSPSSQTSATAHFDITLKEFS